MDQDLRVTLHSLVKLLIRCGRLVNTNFMGNNETWIRPPRYDHVAQVSIIFLDITLTGANRKTLKMVSIGQAQQIQDQILSDLLEQFAKTHRHHAYRTLFIYCPWVTWYI